MQHGPSFDAKRRSISLQEFKTIKAVLRVLIDAVITCIGARTFEAALFES
jgi:hypothetical protein